MMSNISRIKRNVQKMVDAGAPETEVDEYIRSEGVTIEQVRAAQMSPGDNAKLIFDEMVGGIPVLGPLMNRVGDFGEAIDKRIASGTPIGEGMKQAQQERFARRETRPGIATASNIAGTTIGMAPALRMAPAAFGIGKGAILPRIATAAATEGAIGTGHSGVEQLAEYGNIDPTQLIAEGVLSTAGGAAGPVADEVVGLVGRGIRNKVIDPLHAVVRPKEHAARLASRAIREDRAMGAGLSPAEMRAAQSNAQPVIAADMGGARTQNLARAATNIDPGAENIVRQVNKTRFQERGGRLRNYLSDMTGGRVDDQIEIERLQAKSRAENKKRYARAYNSPAAKGFLPDSYGDLKDAPVFISAMEKADKALKNKLSVAPRGSLEWWDQVSRNLRDMSEKAKRSGAVERANDIKRLRDTLLDDLDAAVPAFKEARLGAYRAFGARDAIESGAQFAKTTGNFSKMAAAHRKLSKADKKLFEIGYAAQLRNAALDNPTGALNRLNSDGGRQRAIMVFGKQRAAELRTFIKIENIIEQFNRAQGNSTTARQLIQAGAVGGGAGGYQWITGGDPGTALSTGLAVAAGTRGAQMLRNGVRQRYLVQVADMLVSGDPAILARLEKMAAKSTGYEKALDAIMAGIAQTVRGGIRNEMQSDPLQIYLNADERDRYMSAQ